MNTKRFQRVAMLSSMALGSWVTVSFAQLPEAAEIQPLSGQRPHPEFLMHPLHTEKADQTAATINLNDNAPGFDLSRLLSKATGAVVGPNVIVNDPQVPFPVGLIGRSEVSIAVAKKDRVVVGWNDAEGFCAFFPGLCQADHPGLSGFGFSSDQGETFTDGGTPPPFILSDGTSIMTRGDPSLGCSGSGEGPFYYANLADAVNFAGPSGILVHRGIFNKKGSFAWNPARTRFIPQPPDEFYDKELIAVEPFGSGKRAYISYTNFKAPNFWGQIELRRTLDDGKTWSKAFVAAPEIGTDFFTGTVLQGSEPAVAPDGKTIYVAYEQGPVFVNNVGFLDYEIRVARSGNQGGKFAPGVRVAKINGLWLRAAPAGYNRPFINDFPRIAVIKNGPHEGRVLVVYHSAKTPTSTDTDVFLSYSDDRGKTWTQTVISDETGVQEFWPDIAVGEDDDEPKVVVQYYRGVPGTTQHPVTGATIPTTFTNTFLAESENGGASFNTPFAVSSHTSDWAGTISNIVPNFGDYNTVEVRGSEQRVYCAWAGNDEIVNFSIGPRPVPCVVFAQVTRANSKEAAPIIQYTEIPKDFNLGQNYPNPFNPETNITFDLPEASHVSLKIYDVMGREVAALVDGEQGAGKYRIPFSARSLPSGMYFYKLVAGEHVAVKKMLVQK
jgi:hypothetical protein